MEGRGREGGVRGRYKVTEVTAKSVHYLTMVDIFLIAYTFELKIIMVIKFKGQNTASCST